jgi:ADP-heptose:LPS heptosyltransferase
MPSLSAFRKYQKKHPHYIRRFLSDICHIWWWILSGEKIIVLTAESGGLGDSLWIRSYYQPIREYYIPQKCRIIVIGMVQWEPFVYEMDADPSRDHFDIYSAFESPDNPLKIEALLFKLFHADVFVNFRERHLYGLVKAKEYYSGKGCKKTMEYYETANNKVISKWFPLKENFCHRPPLLPVKDLSRASALDAPYVVLAEKGNTQGRLTDEQTITIVRVIISQGFNIFFNGEYKRLINNLSKHNINNSSSQIIDGYSYPLIEYPTIVNNCKYVVTVNTFIYHLAIQLKKQCVVMSANEYESVKLDAPNQIILFNKELQQAYECNELNKYVFNNSVGLKDIESNRISDAIQRINK